MEAPKNYRYLETHEWHNLEGDTVTIGITHYAADELTDITFVSLPKVGTVVEAGKRFGEIESVKASSDLYSGVSGTVSAVNNALNDNPGLVNKEPYTGGWMVKLKVTDPGQMAKLLSADDYLKKTGH